MIINILHPEPPTVMSLYLFKELAVEYEKVLSRETNGLKRDRTIDCQFTLSFITNDVESQYRYGWVARGGQPPSTPHAPHQHTHKKLLKHFLTHADGRTEGWTNERTDKASHSVACPKLKIAFNGVDNLQER